MASELGLECWSRHGRWRCRNWDEMAVMFIKSYRTFYSQIFFFLSSELQGEIFPKLVFLLYIFSIDQYESATDSIYFWNHLNLNCYLVAQPCLTLCDIMDCSPPDSSVHGIFQARTLEWVAISFSNNGLKLSLFLKLLVLEVWSVIGQQQQQHHLGVCQNHRIRTTL